MSQIVTLFDYQKQFLTYEDCFNYLVQLRWSNGFVCPKCDGSEYYMI